MIRTSNWFRAGAVASLLLLGVVLPARADTPALGVGCRPENRVLSSSLKERYHVDGGALVDYICPNSPADQADIRVGDIIVSFQGQRVADWGALTQAILASHPGDSVVIGVVRAERFMDVKAVLGTRSVDAQQAAPPPKRAPFTLGTFLLALAAANAAKGQQPAGDQGQGLNGNAGPGYQDSPSDQDDTSAAERARLQAEAERQRQEEESERQLEWQREQLEQEQERAQQRCLQEREYQHEQDMLRLKWMYRPPCPPAGSSYSAAVPPRYYQAPARSYSRGPSCPGLTLPQIWQGTKEVGGALLDAVGDTLNALIGN